MPDGPTTWTIMLFLAGDNNLTDECIYGLTEIMNATSDEQIRIVAQFDPKDEHLPSQRYKFGRGEKPGTLSRSLFDESTGGDFKIRSSKDKLVRSVGAGTGTFPNDTATGDPSTLFNFVSMCIEKFPAHHYMLVVSGHGSGTERDYLLKDESPNGFLTIPEFKWALQQVRNHYEDTSGEPLVLDVLGMDVCLMCMTEICYELRDLTRVLVGCESYSPASGWPFRRVFDRLAKIVNENPEAATEPVQNRVSKAFVEEYVNFYSEYWLGGLSVDQSALDVTQVEALVPLINALADSMITAIGAEEERENAKPVEEPRSYPFKDALLLSHWESQSYNGELYVDLADFCHCLRRRSSDGDVNTACGNLADFIETHFVLKSCYSGPTYQYSYGVSIYFPWSEIAPDYQNLDFAKHSTWSHFLDRYIEVTRRSPRAVERGQPFFDFNFASPQRFRQSSGKGPENPMHSMRNPPIVALPSPCTSDESTEVWAQLFS